MDPKLDLVLPEGFFEALLEVVDPKQSVTYFEGYEVTILVQVPPISLENKLVRLAKADSNEMIQRSAAEIISFYCGKDLKWTEEHLREDEASKLYYAFLEKCKLNDIVIEVVQQVEKKIEWHKTDEKERKSWEKYAPASVFVSALLFCNYSSETHHPRYFIDNTTRGMQELMRLNSLVNTDRILSSRPKTKEEEANTALDDASEMMKKANTLDEYLDGLSKQGFNAGDLFG